MYSGFPGLGMTTDSVFLIIGFLSPAGFTVFHILAEVVSSSVSRSCVWLTQRLGSKRILLWAPSLVGSLRALRRVELYIQQSS